MHLCLYTAADSIRLFRDYDCLEIYFDVIKFADLDSCLISATVLHHASPQGVSLVCSDQAGDS